MLKLISVDSLQIFALRMAEKNVGIVTGDYQLYDQESAGEASYWRYQQEIRKAESLTGSVIGPPGALYAIKSELFEAIPVDTINDDFVFPMMSKNFSLSFKLFLICFSIFFDFQLI